MNLKIFVFTTYSYRAVFMALKCCRLVNKSLMSSTTRMLNASGLIGFATHEPRMNTDKIKDRRF